MEKGGDLDDCICTPEASELSNQLSNQERDDLPLPGEVDFINGGPPCQVLVLILLILFGATTDPGC